MNNKNWFQEQYEELENDPLYIAAGLMIDINEKFYERMKKLGMSQRDLAKAIGKSQPYVSKILNRGTNMTLETLALFAIALKMEVRSPQLIPIPDAESNIVTKCQHISLAYDSPKKVSTQYNKPTSKWENFVAEEKNDAGKAA